MSEITIQESSSRENDIGNSENESALDTHPFSLGEAGQPGEGEGNGVSLPPPPLDLKAGPIQMQVAGENGIPGHQLPIEITESDLDATERTLEGSRTTERYGRRGRGRRVEGTQMAAAGRAMERPTITRWMNELHGEGYTYAVRNSNFGGARLGIRAVYRRGGPDMIAVDFARGRILIGDATANPHSMGRVRRRQVPHLTKTARDADLIGEALNNPRRQIRERLIRAAPEEYRASLRQNGFTVEYQDRYWEDGYSQSPRRRLSGSFGRRSTIAAARRRRARRVSSAGRLMSILGIVFGVSMGANYAMAASNIRRRNRARSQSRRRLYRNGYLDLYNFTSHYQRVFDHPIAEARHSDVGDFMRASQYWVRADYRSRNPRGEHLRYYTTKLAAGRREMSRSNSTDILGDLMVWLIDNTEKISEAKWALGLQKERFSTYETKLDAAVEAEGVGTELLEELAQSLTVPLDDVMVLYHEIRRLPNNLRRFMRSINQLDALINEVEAENTNRRNLVSGIIDGRS